MATEQAELIGGGIADILDAHEDEQVIASVKQKVLALCNDFPVYPNLIKH